MQKSLILAAVLAAALAACGKKEEAPAPAPAPAAAPAEPAAAPAGENKDAAPAAPAAPATQVAPPVVRSSLTLTQQTQHGQPISNKDQREFSFIPHFLRKK